MENKIRMFMIALLLSPAFFACKTTSNDPINTPSTAFVPKDSIIGNNFFQVEFSTDSKSMVWCEQIPASSGKAKIWYADMDLASGLPNLSTKLLIDTIQGQGWPYWGHTTQGRFFIYMNQRKQIKFTRRIGTNNLQTFNLGVINTQPKSLLNVSNDSTKVYFWVNYIVLNAGSGKDSLFAFRSDNPTQVKFIDAEVPNTGGSAYELTFPRWQANSEILAYPFRPIAGQPYWDIKFWNGQTLASTQVTNDVPSSVLNHHVDDLPFTLPNQTNTYLFSSKSARTLSIYQRGGNSGFFTLSESYTTPTTLSNYILTSFEPFTINFKTYGAYQVYENNGTAIPGTTKGEIWLKGILGEATQLKISTFDGVTVDPEYVIGNKKVWIYYYGKSVGSSLFDLHRCETPLTK
ncbi:MAG: hypothetical protein H7Y04_07345 [Verrucomicrobia bacterium]|nr:hypothetical protein [Cytophagales bacterium]